MYFSFKTHLSDKPGNKEGKTSIETVAWNILIGDTIHNIADGIAIGVAFSTKVSVGISTSIAVFCHELPHELGKYTLLCLILCTVFLIFGGEAKHPQNATYILYELSYMTDIFKLHT